MKENFDEWKKRIQRGENVECPFCHKGRMFPVNKYVEKCDTCGKAIVPRVPLKIDLI